MVAELGPGAFAELNFQSDLVSKLDAVKQNGYAVDPQWTTTTTTTYHPRDCWIRSPLISFTVFTAARCLRWFVKRSADMVPLAWLYARIGLLYIWFLKFGLGFKINPNLEVSLDFQTGAFNLKSSKHVSWCYLPTTPAGPCGTSHARLNSTSEVRPTLAVHGLLLPRGSNWMEFNVFL